MHQLVDTRVSPPRPIGGQANGANLECDSNTARGKIISEWTLQCPLNRESPLLFTISVHRTGRCALHGSITEQHDRPLNGHLARGWSRLGLLQLTDKCTTSSASLPILRLPLCRTNRQQNRNLFGNLSTLLWTYGTFGLRVRIEIFLRKCEVEGCLTGSS